MKIILIGFMGSGKSTVAAQLAKILNITLIETDELVVSTSGRASVKDIFATDGEIGFREMEIKVAKICAQKNNIVIATGGGMVVNKLCIDYIKQDGVVVYLSTPFSEIEKRLKGDDTRPLFRDKVAAKKLFQSRKKLYETYSNVTVSTKGRSVTEITNLIIKKI